jgi:hypothetical protein
MRIPQRPCEVYKKSFTGLEVLFTISKKFPMNLLKGELTELSPVSHRD